MPRLSVSLYQQVYQRWGLGIPCSCVGSLGFARSRPLTQAKGMVASLPVPSGFRLLPEWRGLCAGMAVERVNKFVANRYVGYVMMLV